MHDHNETSQETPLTGGLVTSVVRVGDTVRRATGTWSPAVHAVLKRLESVGFEAAPRLQGTDSQGREILSFIDGDVPSGAHPSVVTNAALADVGRLIRQLHDATQGFVLPDGVTWHHRPMGGPEPHVVCHHDLSPRNTVFRAGRAVAFIDWDLANLDAPIHDLFHAAWQFVPLAVDQSCHAQGWTTLPDRPGRLRMMLDAYGLRPEDRVGFAAGVAGRIEMTASGIEQLAEAGWESFVRLAEGGHVGFIRADRDWVLAHADELDRAL